MRFLLFCIAGFLLGSCSNKKDIYDTPTFSKNNILQAVVEIPAGTNKKIEYDNDLRVVVVRTSRKTNYEEKLKRKRLLTPLDPIQETPHQRQQRRPKQK